MEKASVEELLEVANDAQVDQLPYICRLAAGQLLPLKPAGGQHPP